MVLLACFSRSRHRRGRPSRAPATFRVREAVFMLFNVDSFPPPSHPSPRHGIRAILVDSHLPCPSLDLSARRAHRPLAARHLSLCKLSKLSRQTIVDNCHDCLTSVHLLFCSPFCSFCFQTSSQKKYPVIGKLPFPRSGSGGNRTNRSFCLPIGFFGEFSGTTSAIPRMEGARRATGHAPLREGGGAATDGMSMPGKRQAPGAATGGSTAGSRRGTWIAMPARSGSSPLRMAPVEAGIDGHPQYSPRRPFHSLRNRNPRTVFLRAAPPSRRAVMGLASGGAGAVWFAA